MSEEKIVEGQENEELQNQIKEAILKVEKKFEVEAMNIDDKNLSDEMKMVIYHGAEAQEFLEEVAPDVLAEIYKGQQKKLDELIEQSKEDWKQQNRKVGIVKKIKESFALAGGIFAIIGVLFTFVVLGGSVAEGNNLQDAGDVYKGWLDSKDAIVLVEKLSNEYLEQYKTGEISYEEYREKMQSIGSMENLQKYVKLPAAEKYISAAQDCRNALNVGGVGALSAVAVSATSEAARGVAYMVEKSKKKKRHKADDYNDHLWKEKKDVDFCLEQLERNK